MIKKFFSSISRSGFHGRRISLFSGLSALMLSSIILASCSDGSSNSVKAVSSSSETENIARNVNGQVWKDTKGNDIQAHDNILYYQGKYYWYGLDYSKNLINGGTGGFTSVKCYESEDLANWKFKNNVLVSTSSIVLNECDINCVQVLYNRKTKKFVMWMGYNTKQENDKSLSYWTLRTHHNRLYLNANLCATCDTPDGCFDVENSFFFVDGGAAVTSLFQDTDGTAYCIDWANYDNSWRLYINRLSEDYLRVESNCAKLYPENYVGRASIVHRGDYYYLIGASYEGELDGGANGQTSGDGWLDYHFTYFDFYRNNSKSNPKSYAGVRYAFSKKIDGTWSDLMKFGPDYADSEFSSVARIQGTEETSYILMFNKWNKSDLSKSGYVWEKLQFKKVNELFDKPYFESCNSLLIDADKGVVVSQ